MMAGSCIMNVWSYCDDGNPRLLGNCTYCSCVLTGKHWLPGQFILPICLQPGEGNTLGGFISWHLNKIPSLPPFPSHTFPHNSTTTRQRLLGHQTSRGHRCELRLHDVTSRPSLTELNRDKSLDLQTNVFLFFFLSVIRIQIVEEVRGTLKPDLIKWWGGGWHEVVCKNT